MPTRPQRERRTPLDDFAQRIALHILHGDEGLSVVLADVVDGDDIRMMQTTG